MLFMACYKVGFWQVFVHVLIRNHLRPQDNHYKLLSLNSEILLFVIIIENF